jgi:replicative DNA helicase
MKRLGSMPRAGRGSLAMSELFSPDRLPPQSKEAEKGVIGSILRDNAVLNDIQNIIRPDNFYFDAHQKIFQAINETYNEGKPVDAVILFEVLKQRKQLEDIGGAAYIAELWEAAPTAANAEYYARIVREKALIRNLIHTNTELLRDAYDGIMSADELLGQAERQILEIAEKGVTSETHTLEKTLRDAFDRIDSRVNTAHLSVSGIPTGFVDLDNITAGLQNNEMIIIAARPSVGKTAFSLNLVRHIIVEEKLPVFFVSLEQSRIELAERLLCCQARVDSHSLRKGHLQSGDIQKLIQAGDQLKGNSRDGLVKLFIDDSPAQTMLRISANARRLKLRHQIRLVVIDYLQLIEPENRRDPRQEQVAQISRRLKHLARELQIPVIALAQVNRASEDRQDHKPRLSDLRESGSIEQDADTVMILHRPGKFEGGQEDNTLEIIIAKQRNGPTGEIMLAYLKQYMRYENYAADFGGSM